MGHAVGAEVDLRAILGEMQTAIVQHASRVLGELEDDEPASVERVRGLLAPIENFRARAGGGGTTVGVVEGDGDEDEDGDDATAGGAGAS